MLTAVQQDYIEAIYQLIKNSEITQVRVTDIADHLGTKLPTVTRTVSKLTDMGFLNHPKSGKVSLTEKGNAIAGEISHLHQDLVTFFTDILGLDKQKAWQDACQLEHGFSRETAERFHHFLEFYETVNCAQKDKYLAYFKKNIKNNKKYKILSSKKNRGWRG